MTRGEGEAVEPLALTAWADRALGGLTPARHHAKLLAMLEQVAGGEIDRLMVLMPPGSAKSTYASLIFPAWWLHRHPNSAVIAASHTAELASHFGRRLRNLVAEHCGALGYGLARDNHAAHRFRTTRQGEYFATGVQGPLTGRRADLVLVDDPIKNHAEADSATARDGLWAWWRAELLTRLKPRGRMVLIMTRWHPDDLAGRLLATGEWQSLRLPALADSRDDPIDRTPGEPLWPEWEDAAALERKRRAVGPRVWAALYQQTPRPDTGALFHPTRIGTLDTAPAGLIGARAWDLAATAAVQGRDPDWTVGVRLASDDAGRLIVLDIVRLRGGPHEVAEAIVNTAHRDGKAVPVGLPQDPGQAGKQQVAWLTARLAGYRVSASPETGSKLTRAGPIAAQVDAGNVSLVRASWNAALIEELRDFPLGRKDDQVDALARAYALLADIPAPTRRLHVPLLAR
jgi:predicted phage terminase large subunit-like protein